MNRFLYSLLTLMVMINFFYANEVDTLLLKEYNNNKDFWKMSLFPSFNMASVGQLDNNKPIKALTLSALKYYWVSEFKIANKAMNLSNRSRAFWWFLFLYFYTIIDASIDSEMESFPDENEQLKESK
tara:strand:+ start:77 stop:457 length:381 start_codon:yes stop_codon:yes gene_type:complete